MSDNKSTHDKNDDLDFDLDSFSVRIDNEIDKLFVPSGTESEEEQSAEEPEVALEVTELATPPEPSPKAVEPDPPPPQTAAAPGNGLDLEAFDTLIDREIDSLFIPAASLSFEEDPEPPAKPMDPPAPPKVAAPPVQPPPFVPERPVPEPKTVEAPAMPSLTLELGDPDKSDQELTQPQQQLQVLLDAANAAYLSLDWEFSAENARKYEVAVTKLESYARKSTATTSLFKMLQATARKIRTRPDQAGRDVTEFFRDAHELLSPVLLSQGPLSGWERDKIKSLIHRFNAMRQKTVQQPPEAEAKVQPSTVASITAAPAQPQPQPESQPQPSQAMPSELEDIGSVTAFREWMELQGTQMDQGIARLCEETAHLSEIEEVLARTRALAPLTTRLSSIRRNIEEHITGCRQAAKEWPGQLEWLHQLEKNFNVLVDLSASSSDLKVASPSQPASEAEIPSSVETCSERLCIFTLSGKTIGITASQVVKINEASPKKAFKILTRGYATLDDFKSFFKGLKAGLTDQWKTTPAKALKGMHFLPVRCEALDEAPEPHPVGGAILVSNGSKHGIIFTDKPATDFRDNAEIIVDGTTGKDVLGFILTESGEPIEILNLNRLLEDQQ